MSHCYCLHFMWCWNKPHQLQRNLDLKIQLKHLEKPVLMVQPPVCFHYLEGFPSFLCKDPATWKEGTWKRCTARPLGMAQLKRPSCPTKNQLQDICKGSLKCPDNPCLLFPLEDYLCEGPTTSRNTKEHIALKPTIALWACGLIDGWRKSMPLAKYK